MAFLFPITCLFLARNHLLCTQREPLNIFFKIILLTALSISLCSCTKKPTTTDVQNIRTVQLHVKQDYTNVKEDITLPVEEMLSELFKAMDIKVTKNELSDAILTINIKGRPYATIFETPIRATFYETAVVEGTANLAIKGFLSKKVSLYGIKPDPIKYYPHSNTYPKVPLITACKRAFIKMIIDIWGPPAFLSIWNTSYNYVLEPNDYVNEQYKIIKYKNAPSFVPVIFQALQSDNSSVRLSAVAMLEVFTAKQYYYGGKDKEKIIKMSPNMRETVLKYLSQLNTVVKDEIEKSVGYRRQTKGPIPDGVLIIEKSILILSEFGQDANMAIPLLKEALKNDNNHIKGAALGALADIVKPQESVPILIDALKSKEKDDRRVALNALGKIGSDAKEAIPYIIYMVEHEETYLRGNAARALVKIGPEERAAVPALIQALKSRETHNKSDFTNALEAITGQKFGDSVEKWQEWWEHNKTK